MLAAGIDEGRGWFQSDDIDPCSHERIALASEVRYHRRKRKLAVEPRLDRVVVG
jgi:hypothetical protein